MKAIRMNVPIARACCRYRRGRAKRRLKGAELERAGTNGEGLEDFRGGYGRCIMVANVGLEGESDEVVAEGNATKTKVEVQLSRPRARAKAR